MSLKDDLLASERRLCTADLDFYRAICRADALFLMPGMTVGLDEALAGLQQTPPWDAFTLAEVQVRALGRDAAAISYRFEGNRGHQRYVAYMTSTYVRSEQGWQLVVHQQTPA
ncbi:nuclear transport factor 2 family protein [Comamonadaceae bacterium OH2310_COT-174]|nr:nuclear transport factor 2 family protein [Comamonadaceae bacterium OH2310_COT-174]